MTRGQSGELRGPSTSVRSPRGGTRQVALPSGWASAVALGLSCLPGRHPAGAGGVTEGRRAVVTRSLTIWGQLAARPERSLLQTISPQTLEHPELWT